MRDMDATLIEVLTALFLLVSAVGVLILIGKVERLTARIDSLIGRVERLTELLAALDGTLRTVAATLMDRKRSAAGAS